MVRIAVFAPALALLEWSRKEPIRHRCGNPIVEAMTIVLLAIAWLVFHAVTGARHGASARST